MPKLNNITWSDAVEQAIIDLGYIATLKQIYNIAPKFKDFIGLTPHKTINERVQRDERFIKLKPGLYGLKRYIDKLPDEYNPNKQRTIEEERIITHAYMQGMLIEIGNLNGFKTFSPDKSGLFVAKKLKEIITQPEIPDFTFEYILQSVKYIDVVWFNERHFPNTVFEIEHSTNFRNSLVKFAELQDFVTKMVLIAPKKMARENKFKQEIEKSAFVNIKNRVAFYDYEYIENLYNSQIASQKFKEFFV
jgi:nuclear transport factor 2 (NTF2) superfamily protein